MRTQSIFILILFFLLAVPLFSQSNCRISDVMIDDVHSCTNTYYTLEFSFTASDPVSDLLTIEWPGDLPFHANVKYVIRDITGRALKSGNLTGTLTQLAVDELLAGHYIIELQVSGAIKYTGRFVRIR